MILNDYPDAGSIAHTLLLFFPDQDNDFAGSVRS